ncbi:cytochrome aa3 quinol oxidase subunit IV [Peribacillus psychrosaccharolyticus]|uniref:Quinol oxidase subunit 4 n=1 Tax=Peribacillus psychrosaccharolyticus TaxID=1407 RepID=A0A974RYI4_PERPY|nr:cytochrome aa3 quinol oxidase subunit IV [Peribacillus psychrosaccharolyticus]MEC2056991.1 cytochrome aa3 quinol oxidase subunit IV [Peribacillus psychrosaccharolyticus]MED3744913.1 cytochrome aa3 quinol oxidase subunit IV [Peribacillus psychrosaccharolyticus]QQS98465.1 cytochrome aa3 quinol oxidase subunit IV [Peribacillus psychrosaccharolyticus]
MKQLFPMKQVMGYVFSLILTVVALSVLMFDLSATTGLLILLVTAFAQASMQIVFFMHIGESEDRNTLYTNIGYALFVGIVTILGTLLTMIWGYQ